METWEEEMKFCQKCHSKTIVTSGRVRVQIETTIVEAESPIFSCPKCNMHYGAVQVTIIPNEKIEAPKPEEAKPEGAVIQ